MMPKWLKKNKKIRTNNIFHSRIKSCDNSLHRTLKNKQMTLSTICQQVTRLISACSAGITQTKMHTKTYATLNFDLKA